MLVIQMVITFEEAKKQAFEEAKGTCATYAALTAGTLGAGTVLDGGAHLIPYLVWNEINLYPPRRRVFLRAFEHTNILVGAAGTKIYVPVYGQDEFTAFSMTEKQIDDSGLTKTNPTPTEVEICIGDVVGCATRISDILREDSPTLGWVRASLQMMGFAIQQQMETDAEGVLLTGAAAGGNVVGAATAGVLAYDDIVDVKALMSADSFYYMGQVFYLFCNPEQEADLLKEMGPTSGAVWARDQAPVSAVATGQPIAGFYPLVANCLPLVTENMTNKFALVVIPPTHPYGPAAIWAWKRPLKAENWRDEQKQRDVWALTTRYGYSTKRNPAIGLISNC